MEKHEFMYPDGETRDTALRRAIRRVRSVADTYRHNDYETIETWLEYAVRDNNLAAARYLLAAGLPPSIYDHTGYESHVAVCVRCNMPEMGALLRKHGARLPGYAWRDAQNMVDYYNHPSRMNKRSDPKCSDDDVRVCTHRWVTAARWRPKTHEENDRATMHRRHNREQNARTAARQSST